MFWNTLQNFIEYSRKNLGGKVCKDLVIFLDIFPNDCISKECIKQNLNIDLAFCSVHCSPSFLAWDFIMTCRKLSSQKGRFYHHFIGIKNWLLEILTLNPSFIHGIPFEKCQKPEDIELIKQCTAPVIAIGDLHGQNRAEKSWLVETGAV